MNFDCTCQIRSGDGNRILGYTVALDKIAFIGDVDYWTIVQHWFYGLLNVLILCLHIRMTDIKYVNYHILGKKIFKLKNFLIKITVREKEQEQYKANVQRSWHVLESQ